MKFKGTLSMAFLCVALLSITLMGCVLNNTGGRDKILNKRTRTHVKAKTIMLPGRVPLEMVWIPAGIFMMGSPHSSHEAGWADEWEQHQVTLTHGFWMGKYEVTQKQWMAITGGNNPSKDQGDNRPVENVSWDDVAGDFLPKLNQVTSSTFRLPTEAEWEYACRAGTTTRFYWGEDLSNTDIDKYAWHYENSRTTNDVGTAGISGHPNAFGLYDMSGNVWEWCSDYYFQKYPAVPETDPTGPGRDSSYHVTRGGSCLSSPSDCRSANRGRDAHSNKGRSQGFRLVK